ncbi:MAG TPA: PA14 domain-containing protein [Burkholderiaceae bacterium]|nr:PA14 domain-containing protein [Burkholderiaceae bacterium]
MNSPLPDHAMSTTNSGGAPRWRSGARGYGLAVTVFVHLLLLVAVLSWRSRVPPPKPPRNLDVSIIPSKEQPPPQPVLAPKPEFQPPTPPAILEPPPIVVEAPKPAPVAAPVVAPPVAAPVAAPTPAPVTAAPASAPVAPVGKAVGSTRLAEECADAPDRMMVAEVYRMSTSDRSVNGMNRRKPIRTVCLAQLDFAPRPMGLGLPGLDLSEWYGLDIRFTLNMPVDSSRDFVLLCDDGCTLYVDDQLLVNADGLHVADAVMGTVHLTKGMHHLRVRYFQGPGDGALMLGWKKAGAPTSETKPIPRRLLGRPLAAAAASE